MKEFHEMNAEEREEVLERIREHARREERREFLWNSIHERLLTPEEMEEARDYGKFLNTSEPYNDDERMMLWTEALSIQMGFQLEAATKMYNNAK